MSMVRIIKSKKQIEHSRQQAIDDTHNKHVYRLDLLKNYLESDNPDYPAPLFFHSSLSKKGICPVLTDNGVGRDLWLEKQKLTSVFNSLHSRLYKKSICNTVSQQCIGLLDEIQALFQEYLTTTQYTLLDTVYNLFESYTSAKSKSRKNRDQYNDAINILTQLVKDTNIDLHIFLGSKYKTTVSLGIITQSNPRVQLLNDKIHSLVDVYNEKRSEERFISSTLQSLNLSLTNALFNQQNDEPPVCVDNSLVGKNWSALTPTERNTALLNYSHFHLKSHTQDLASENLQKSLYQFLLSSLESKKIVYKDLKWNKSLGRLDLVKRVYYESASDTWIIQSLTSGNSSAGSVITTKNQHQINDLLLKYLYTINDKQTVFKSIKIDRAHLLAFITNKLDVKHLSKADKEYILNQTKTILEYLQ